MTGPLRAAPSVGGASTISRPHQRKAGGSHAHSCASECHIVSHLARARASSYTHPTASPPPPPALLHSARLFTSAQSSLHQRAPRTLPHTHLSPLFRTDYDAHVPPIYQVPFPYSTRILPLPHFASVIIHCSTADRTECSRTAWDTCERLVCARLCPCQGQVSPALSPPPHRPHPLSAMDPALGLRDSAPPGFRGQPDQRHGPVTLSNSTMPEAAAAPDCVEIPGRPCGGAPRVRASRAGTRYPHICQPGLVRIEVATHYPNTFPVLSDTFDADLYVVPHDDPCWDSKGEFIRFMQYLIFRKLCSVRRVWLDVPAPAGRFIPPIGTSAFFRDVNERGVTCQYVVCWPVVPVPTLTPRSQSPTRARLPPPSIFSSSSSRSTSPESPSCSSTRAPPSAASSEPQRSSPSPDALTPHT